MAGLDLNRMIWVLVPTIIVIRLSYVLALYFGFDIKIGDDYYDDIARNIVAGHGYVITPGDSPNLFRYPGYTYFLAFLIAVFNDSYWAVVLVQLTLDVATIGLVYLLAREVFDRHVALLSAIIMALYPFSALYIIRYTTEPLFTFLLAASMLFLTYGLKYDKRRFFLWAGVMFGAAIWCRPSLFYFLVILPLIVFFISESKKRLMLSGSAVLTSMVAITLLVPWGVRNLEVTGEFNLLGTAGGYSLWIGNFLPFDGRDRDELPAKEKAEFRAHERRIAAGEDLFSLSGEKRFLDATTQSWLAEPVASAWLIIRKAFRFWFSIYQPQNRIYAPVLVTTQALLLLGAIFGIIRGLRNQRGQWHLVALLLYLNMLHALVISTFRYSLPIMPYVIMFIVYGACGVSVFKSRSRSFGNWFMDKGERTRRLNHRT